MKKFFAMILCICLFLSANVYAEMMDFENASIEELEAFLAQVDAAKAALEEKKNSRTAEEMCEIAVEELKKYWANDRYLRFDESTGYFQVIHTRVIYLNTSFENAACIKESERNSEKLLEKCKGIFSNDNGSPMTAVVEYELLTDYYGTHPYYTIAEMNKCVAFYQDGTIKVLTRSPIVDLWSRCYVTNFDGIISCITDMGSQYDESCYLK